MNPLRRLAIPAAIAFVFMGLALPNAHAVTIDWVTVGDPGNAGDTRPDPNMGGRGGPVDYSYQIGTYEVTIQQYTDFLNAAAKSDPYSLYNPNMSTDANIAGIQQNGSSGSYAYSVIGGSGNKPITYVSWFDAARFANWMHNGQGSGSTETGAYTLVEGQTSGDARARNTGAQYYIPTMNEWYKAAYYSPLLNSGSGGYYEYATQNNSTPDNMIGGGSNQANYLVWRGGITGNVFSVTQSNVYDANQNYLTDVGSFANSASYYGTFDQTGNVYEWNDLDGTQSSVRAVRGGRWQSGEFELSSSYGGLTQPFVESKWFGFRLASPVSGPSSVPEIDPNSLGSVLALVLGSLGLLERRRLKAA
jgi:sulfatase modifying factor 1